MPKKKLLTSDSKSKSKKDNNKISVTKPKKAKAAAKGSGKVTIAKKRPLPTLPSRAGKKTNASKDDWGKAVQPLIKKYGNKKHPLEYKNYYQLVVMVVLSAQSNDKLINDVAVNLFKAFPDFESLARTDIETLIPYISKVIGHRKKGEWILKIAQTIKHQENIPFTIKELTAMPGLGRKSANVIMREMHKKAEGVIVDLHVLRVAPRIGIAHSEDPKKMELELMAAVPDKYWGDLGMSISHLGREVCRPTDPKHGECVMKENCFYFKNLKFNK